MDEKKEYFIIDSPVPKTFDTKINRLAYQLHRRIMVSLEERILLPETIIYFSVTLGGSSEGTLFLTYSRHSGINDTPAIPYQDGTIVRKTVICSVAEDHSPQIIEDGWVPAIDFINYLKMRPDITRKLYFGV